MKYIANKNFLNGKQKRVKVGDAVIQGTERDQYDEDAIKLYKNNGMIVTEEDFEKRQAENKKLAEAQEKVRTPSDEKSLKKALSDAKSEIEALQSENTELKEKSQKVVDKAVENQKALEMKISNLEDQLEEATKPVETDGSDSKDVGGDKDKSTGPSENK